MKFHQAGDKSKAICEDCGSVVPATYAYRDVPFDDGNGIAKDVLAIVCDSCDRVVAFPAQSTPAAVRARKAAEIPLEVSLTAPEMDLLDLAALRIDPQAGTKLRKTLIAYFLRRLSEGSESILRLQQICLNFKKQRSSAAGIPSRRLSPKLAPRTNDNIRALMQLTGLKKIQLIRVVIGEIQEVLVLSDHPKELGKICEIADLNTA